MASSRPLTDSDVASIRGMRKDWLAALNEDNLDALMKPLAEDIAAFPPNEGSVHGLDAQRAWHQGRIAQFTTRLSITSDELIGSGDFVLDQFSYTITLTPKAGGPAVSDSGTCFWAWRRDEGGNWQLARAIWNSSNPIAAAV